MNLPPEAQEALHHYSRGDLRRAEPAARKAVGAAPHDQNLQQLHAAILVGLNRPADAIEILEKIVRLGSPSGELLYNLGTALAAAGRHSDAVPLLKNAAAAKPRDPHCHNNLGLSLLATSAYRDAKLAFDRALELAPNWPAASYHRGRALAALGDHLQAVESYKRILTHTRSVPAELMFSLGFSLHRLGLSGDALEAYDRALAIDPRCAPCHNDRGGVLVSMKRYSAALESYDRAIALKPDYFEAYSNRGTVLIRLNQAAAALRSFDRAIAIKPDFLEAHHGRGIALSRLNRHEEAVASHSRALAIDPSNADASYSRGNALKELNRLPEAMSSYEQAAASEPDHPLALSAIAYLALCLCDWEVLGRVRQPLFESCMLPTFKGMCFPVLAMSDDLALQEATARHYVQNNLPQMSAKPPIQRHPGRRIRLGYLSADFGDHPTSYLLAELIELHDRDRFEVYGFSVGSDDRSQMRQRLRSAFDDFIDVRGMSDEALAAAIRNAEIDIIIDLGGHTHDGRILALAGRPAPVQVTYLGYPGTVGAPFIDYAIVDRHVVPVEAEQYFQEKLIRLPDAYQVNDRKRQIGELTLSRSDCGLPDDGFVFCCFNHVNKINPAVFDTWMRILQGTPRSVLWLLQDNEWASENLRNEAIRRGAPSQRLVFAPKIKLADHLSRLRLADLFLDTWPYNAHTTASDALWVGLPVLTLTGKSFASRVAGSLLHAVRMPEMVTQTSDEYVELAIRLGNSSAMARALSDKLKANIHTTALFNTPLTCRHIEAAFTRVWERYQRSESPQTVTLCN